MIYKKSNKKKKQNILQTMELFNFIKYFDFAKNEKQKIAQNKITQEFFERILYDVRNDSKTLELLFRKKVVNEITKRELFLFNQVKAQYNLFEPTRHKIFMDKAYVWDFREARIFKKHLEAIKKQHILLNNPKIWYYSFSMKYQYLRFLRKLRIYLLTLDMFFPENSNGWLLETLRKYLTRDWFWEERDWPYQETILSKFNLLNDSSEKRDYGYTQIENKYIFGYTVSEFANLLYTNTKKETPLWLQKTKKKNLKKWKNFKYIFAFNISDMPQYNGVYSYLPGYKKELYSPIIIKQFFWFVSFKKRIFFGWLESVIKKVLTFSLKDYTNKFVASVEHSNLVNQYMFKLSKKHRHAFCMLLKTPIFFENYKTFQKIKPLTVFKKYQDSTQNWFTFAFFELCENTVAKKETILQLHLTELKQDKNNWKFQTKYKKIPVSLFYMTTTTLFAKELLLKIINPLKKKNVKKKRFFAFSNALTPSAIPFLPKKTVYLLQQYKIWFSHTQNSQKNIKNANKKMFLFVLTNEKIETTSRRSTAYSRLPFNGWSFFNYLGTPDYNQPSYQFYHKYNNPFFFRKFWKNYIADKICLKTPNFFEENELFSLVSLSKNFATIADRPTERIKAEVNQITWNALFKKFFKSPLLKYYGFNERERIIHGEWGGRDYNLRNEKFFTEITEMFLHDFDTWNLFYLNKRSLILYNSVFLKYIPIFFHFFFSKVFTLPTTFFKNRQRSLVAQQLNNIFQKFNYIWYENQIEDSLENGKKFANFYPQHVYTSNTINYPSNNGPYDYLSKQGKYVFSVPKRVFGLAWPVAWQIIFPLETNKKEYVFFFKPKFFEACLKIYYSFLNTSIKILTKIYFLSIFIQSFFFIFAIYLIIIYCKDFFSFFKFLYQNWFFEIISKFANIYENLILKLEIRKVFNYKTTISDSFYHTLWFYSLYEPAQTNYFITINLPKNIHFFETYIQHKLGLQDTYNFKNNSTDTLSRKNGIMEFSSLYLNAKNDLFAESHIAVKQFVISVSIWLLHYNVYYFLICFFTHFIQKLLNFQERLFFNTIFQKSRNFWLTWINVLLLVIQILLKFLLFFIFVVEFILLKFLIYYLYEIFHRKLRERQNQAMIYIWEPYFDKFSEFREKNKILFVEKSYESFNFIYYKATTLLKYIASFKNKFITNYSFLTGLNIFNYIAIFFIKINLFIKSLVIPEDIFFFEKNNQFYINVFVSKLNYILILIIQCIHSLFLMFKKIQQLVKQYIISIFQLFYNFKLDLTAAEQYLNFVKKHQLFSTAQVLKYQKLQTKKMYQKQKKDIKNNSFVENKTSLNWKKSNSSEIVKYFKMFRNLRFQNIHFLKTAKIFIVHKNQTKKTFKFPPWRNKIKTKINSAIINEKHELQIFKSVQTKNQNLFVSLSNKKKINFGQVAAFEVPVFISIYAAKKKSNFLRRYIKYETKIFKNWQLNFFKWSNDPVFLVKLFKFFFFKKKKTCILQNTKIRQRTKIKTIKWEKLMKKHLNCISMLSVSSPEVYLMTPEVKKKVGVVSNFSRLYKQTWKNKQNFKNIFSNISNNLVLKNKIKKIQKSRYVWKNFTLTDKLFFNIYKTKPFYKLFFAENKLIHLDMWKHFSVTAVARSTYELKRLRGEFRTEVLNLKKNFFLNTTLNLRAQRNKKQHFWKYFNLNQQIFSFLTVIKNWHFLLIKNFKRNTSKSVLNKNLNILPLKEKNFIFLEFEKNTKTRFSKNDFLLNKIIKKNKLSLNKFTHLNKIFLAERKKIILNRTDKSIQLKFNNSTFDNPLVGKKESVFLNRYKNENLYNLKNKIYKPLNIKNTQQTLQFYKPVLPVNASTKYFDIFFN